MSHLLHTEILVHPEFLFNMPLVFQNVQVPAEAEIGW